jgi:hypothetical protein
MRELVEPLYIIVYSIDEHADEIEVLANVHGAEIEAARRKLW